MLFFVLVASVISFSMGMWLESTYNRRTRKLLLETTDNLMRASYYRGYDDCAKLVREVVEKSNGASASSVFPIRQANADKRQN